MPRFTRTAHRMSLTSMFTVMSMIFLYLASILPAGRVAAYFLSSVFVMGLALEEEYGLAWLMFAAASAVSLLLVPDMLRVVPYVLFFGHYGIGKYYLETHMKDKVTGYILKLLYYNAALILIYLFARNIVKQDVLYLGIPLWAVIILAEVAFVLYDFLFTKITSYYVNNLRRLLMKG